MRARSVARVVLAVALLGGVAGCRGDRSDLTAPAAKGPAAPVAAGPDFRDPFPSGDPKLVDALGGFYSQLLRALDEHVTAPAAPRSGLEALAVPAVVARVEAERQANVAFGQGFQRVTKLASTPSILGVDVAGPRATIRDCTIEQRTYVTGQTITSYVTRTVQVANHGGTFRAATVEVPHDGTIGATGYGCATKRMTEDAERTVRTIVDLFGQARRRPANGFPAALDAVTDGELQKKLQEALAEQAARGLVIVSPVEVTIKVLGLDPQLLGTFAVASACMTYPQGLATEAAAGGARREFLPPGSRSRVDYGVQVEPGEAPVGTKIVSEELRASC